MAMVKTRDGTHLYVKDWSLNGIRNRPVVLMHGWPLSADSWDDVALALVEQGFWVIAYDRRGFGRSEQPFDGYDYDHLADDLSDVMEAYDLKDAAIAGFSMGGGEVARYMSRHQAKRVSKAVLVSAVVPYMLQTDDNPNGTPQAVFDQMLDGIKADRPKFFTDFFKDFYGVSMLSHPVSPECLTWTHTMAMQASLRATLACVKAFSSTDFRPDLAHFSVPTLIIHGTKDKTVPIEAAGRAAAAQLPQATFIEYEDAPHGLIATHRARLIDDLLKFLWA